MAKQATAKATERAQSQLDTRVDQILGTMDARDRLRAGLLERVTVMRAACEARGTTFDAWYSDGAEIGEGEAVLLASHKTSAAWAQLRRFAEAADLTVAELLWSVGLDLDESNESTAKEDRRNGY